MLYTYMSAQNGPDKQAIAEFRAREFLAGKGQLEFSSVRSLNRDEVGQVCPRLGEVQERTDAAAQTVATIGRKLTPQQYGTAVHANLKQQIDDLHNPDFVAERSFAKENRAANYGGKGTIRVDVYENVGNGTVCVYDIKTGQKGLDLSRMSEFASRIYTKYPATRRIIVSEIRPSK
jgi:hypothetical protein